MEKLIRPVSMVKNGMAKNMMATIRLSGQSYFHAIRNAIALRTLTEPGTSIVREKTVDHIAGIGGLGLQQVRGA